MATMCKIEKSPSRLMYLFGSFRPSERATLLESAKTDAKAFNEALKVFLAKWAEASWLEEYNVERVGEWIAAKCPISVQREARLIAERELDLAKADDTNRVRTYRAFVDGMARNGRSNGAVVLPLNI